MIDPRWRKVIRDLWGNKTRTFLVVMAIAVGVFAFGSVFITQEVLVSDMDTQFHDYNASTITMSIPAFDDSLVRWARRQEQVVDAQGRALRSVKLVGQARTFNLNLYAYDDYEHIKLNRITSEKGKWPPGRREILFERASVSLPGVQIGDNIIIELSDGQQYELNITGTVHDLNAVPANLNPQLTGYVSMKTMGWLGFGETYNRLEIVAQEEFNNLARLEVVADELRDRLQRTGFSVGSVNVLEPGEHWGRDTTQSFTLILNFIGIFALLLSGFLVINTISAMLTQQRRQVGMMKAVGGTGRQIMSLYLVLVAFYGLLALVVALPVGMGLAYLFIVAVNQFLNLDMLHFYLPLSIFLLQLIVALLVPIVASIIPVLGGVRVTVREAISSYGIEGTGGSGLLDRLLLRVRGLPRPVLLSLRNTFRRKGRLFLTLGTLTLAGTLFITVMNVRGSLMTEVDNLIDSTFNYQVILGLDGSYPSQGVERRAEEVPGVVHAEGRTTLWVKRVKPDGTKGGSFEVTGLPPDSDFIQPTMLSGRWLEENDRNAIVLSSELARWMSDVHAGDEIVVEVNDREYRWKVAGIMLMAWEGVGFADFNYLSRIRGNPGQAVTMSVSTEQKDGQSQFMQAEAVKQRLKDAGIKVGQSSTIAEFAGSIASQFDFLIMFLMAMAAMSALIGGLGLAGIMSLNVMERTREIGVMRSIGASNSMVGGIVLIEGLLIGIISWVLAIPLSIPVTLLFNAMLGQMIIDQPLVFVFLPIGLVTWFIIVVVVSVVASLLPAYRAIKMSVRETLAYE
ncbi:MAG: ABC transporter permease [Chloroflexi bacterium]|nr:ABC transporter permease [Chloroflexota bacterium]